MARPRLLDATDDRAEWLAYWLSSGRDPFAHPSYATLFAGQAGTPHVWCFDYSDGSAIIPVIVRHIPNAAGLRDLTSPYGYGGPFFTGVQRFEAVLQAFKDWLCAERFCSAFLRLSLDATMVHMSSLHQYDVGPASPNVVVNLRQEPEEIWMGYEHKVRKNVQKARRAGCSVVLDHDLDQVPDFLDIYAATMRRNNAAPRYNFSDDFFAALGSELKGSYSVFSALDASGTTVSSELVLEGEQYLYSSLGGTMSNAFSMRPNDLLKHEIVLYGIRTGRSAFVLGGGYAENDGILRYKRSFAPTGLVTFYTAKMVGDRSRYAQLCAAHAGEAGETARRSDYFPEYRRP